MAVSVTVSVCLFPEKKQVLSSWSRLVSNIIIKSFGYTYASKIYVLHVCTNLGSWNVALSRL